MKEEKDNFWQVLGASLSAMLGWGVVAYILITASCAHAPVPVVMVDMTGVIGQTTCDTAGNTVILVNATNPDALHRYGLGYILLHEQTHVNQVRMYGGCRKFMKRYNSDEDFAFDMEAQAYCGELELRVLKGASRVELFRGLVFHIRTMLPDLTLEEVADRLPCQGGPNASRADSLRKSALQGGQIDSLRNWPGRRN